MNSCDALCDGLFVARVKFGENVHAYLVVESMIVTELTFEMLSRF